MQRSGKVKDDDSTPQMDLIAATVLAGMCVCEKTVAVTEKSPYFPQTCSAAHRGTFCPKREAERNRYLDRSVLHTTRDDARRHPNVLWGD